MKNPFKKKPQRVENLIPYDDASELVEKFWTDVRASAEKYGITHYVAAVEFFAIKDDKRGSWLSHISTSRIAEGAALAAWLYGALRGRLDAQLTEFKNISFDRENKV